MPKLRADQAVINVQLRDPRPGGAGKNILDTTPWTTMDGGDMQATDTKTRPGGMGLEENLGGPKTRTDCMVERHYTNDVIHSVYPQIEALVGEGTGTISWRPLDADGNPTGNTLAISGVLKELKRGKWDANATEAIMVTLTFGCNATPVTITG